MATKATSKKASATKASTTKKAPAKKAETKAKAETKTTAKAASAKTSPKRIAEKTTQATSKSGGKGRASAAAKKTASAKATKTTKATKATKVAKTAAANRTKAVKKGAAPHVEKKAKAKQGAQTGDKKQRKVSTFITPNFLTVVRIILAFAWLALFDLFIEPPSVMSLQITRFASVNVPILIFAGAFLLIAFTDLLDGYYARKKNKVSSFGIFLDPIADKILVICSLLLLMQYNYINIWVIVIIASREFLVAGIRMCVAEKGIVAAANGLGKAKTVITILAIFGFFVYMALPPLLLATIILFWLCQFLLLFAIFFTIWSGIEYYTEYKRYL